MPQPTDTVPPSQHCLARALYDNVPDSPDELAFRKGDTLTVLEQNTANIEGWWLCSLRGRQGICPANRLRLIPGVYDDHQNQPRVCSPQFTEIPADFSCLQRQGKRRSWHVQPNQVVTPKKFNDVYLYDMPSRCSPVPVPGASPGLSPRDPLNDCYDVPPHHRPIPVHDHLPRNNNNNCARCSPAPSCISPISRDSAEAYDTPRSLLSQPNQLTPSSSASSLTADSLSSSNRSSLANMPDYDVPRPFNSRGPQLVLHAPQTQSYYDTPPSLLQNVTTSTSIRELPLELGSALENLERLQTDTAGSISKLLGFVGPQWRTRDRLEPHLLEIKFAVVRLKTSLHDLADFAEGALGNAARASDKNLAAKLAPLVAALRKSDVLVADAADKLNEIKWSVDLLSRGDEEDRVGGGGGGGGGRRPDELEQLVACSRALTEDIRQVASFIQGNGTLLFKKEAQGGNNNNEWLEDYDYVSLESREAVAKKNAEIRAALPTALKKSFDGLLERADDVAFDTGSTTNKADDLQVLTFYAAQAVTHHKNLTHAIDAFLQTVEHNQPPKVFLAHGKFVVLSAHKLVHIGDTVHRNVTVKEVRERALTCANALSDSLTASVNKTKQAALQFPSVTAVQEMVDSIVDISYSARDLKVCLVQAANPM